MNTPSYKFKKMIFEQNNNDRKTILSIIYNWMLLQVDTDKKALACYETIEKIHLLADTGVDDKTFKEHHVWGSMSNHDSCLSFQEFVKAKGVPVKKEVKLEAKIESYPVSTSNEIADINKDLKEMRRLLKAKKEDFSVSTSNKIAEIKKHVKETLRLMNAL